MYHILLVEDDKSLRYLYSRMKVFSECDCSIMAQAGNGREALQMLEKEKFDIIITDIRMPILDGLSLLKEIKARGIESFVILVSSYDEFEYARQGLILGAIDYIVKPVKEDELRDALNRAKASIQEKNLMSNENEIVIKVAQRLFEDYENDAFLKRVTEFVSKASKENLNFGMEEIACMMSLNKDYFGKIFKQKTGIGFGNFCTEFKIEYAKKLLLAGNKNYEIADMLGYASVDYFTKVFKDNVGMTPTKFKENI